MATRPNSDKREYTLTILARMIVRAYLGEIDRGDGPNAISHISRAPLFTESLHILHNLHGQAWTQLVKVFVTVLLAIKNLHSFLRLFVKV